MYKEEEVNTVASFLNTLLADDPECAEYLPIQPTCNELCAALSDGHILIKLLNRVDENAVDMRTVNKYEKDNMAEDAVRQNIIQGLTTAKGLINLDHGINAIGFLEKRPGVILPLFNQLISKVSTKDIDLKNYPEIKKLCKEDENIDDFVQMQADETLLRWVNYHLQKKNCAPVNNLGSDLEDGVVLAHLLNQLDSK